MSNVVIPTKDTLTAFLTPFFGPDVIVADAIENPFVDPVVIEFVSEHAGSFALCMADVGMTVLSAAALLQIPAIEAQEMLLKEDIHPHVWQSFKEFASELASVLRTIGGDHLQLDNIHFPESSSYTADMLNRYSESVSYHIEIPCYGTGVMTFYAN